VDEVSVGDGRVHGPRRERGQSYACLNHYHLDTVVTEIGFRFVHSEYSQLTDAHKDAYQGDVSAVQGSCRKLGNRACHKQTYISGTSHHDSHSHSRITDS
jgi:hypothetical protein